MIDSDAMTWTSPDGKTIVYVGRVEMGPVTLDGATEQPVVGFVGANGVPSLDTTVSVSMPLSRDAVSAWFGALDATSLAADRTRKTNAEARERWRERVLERLYGLCGTIYERPCAACGGPGPWFVCLLCSTGMPSKGTWRIRPEAAARIRAKMAAGAHVPKMPKMDP